MEYLAAHIDPSLPSLLGLDVSETSQINVLWICEAFADRRKWTTHRGVSSIFGCEMHRFGVRGSAGYLPCSELDSKKRFIREPPIDFTIFASFLSTSRRSFVCLNGDLYILLRVRRQHSNAKLRTSTRPFGRRMGENAGSVKTTSDV